MWADCKQELRQHWVWQPEGNKDIRTLWDIKLQPFHYEKTYMMVGGGEPPHPPPILIKILTKQMFLA